MARTNYLDLYFLSADYRLAPRARSGHLPPSRPVEHYHQVCDINIRGVLLSMKHEIPAMLRSGGVPSSITPPPQATSAFRAPRFMPPASSLSSADRLQFRFMVRWVLRRD
jgi:hypothetical protein